MNKTITASIALAIALMSAQPLAAPASAMNDQRTAVPVAQERNFYDAYVKQFVHNDNGEIIGTTRETRLNQDWLKIVSERYSLTVDGQRVDAGAVLDGNYLLIPLRPVMEEMGYELTWNAENKSVEAVKGALWTGVELNKDQYNYAKMPIELGKAPVIKENRMYVPLQFAGEVLKADVSLNEQGDVTIQSRPDQLPEDSFGGMHWVIVVNGEGIGVPSEDVFTTEDDVMVPAGAIGKALGYTVEQNKDTGAYEFVRGAKWIALKEGGTTAAVGKMNVELKTAPIVKDGKLYLPFNSLADVFGVKTGIDPTGVIGIQEELSS
ncbi:copper amine oxidase N-terminal domain-containing protein [Paenibacillus dendritiformis]|uniref:copper amine oxidase N-terminal domain-containing protein n=1 Tax=Paenibacillus dendritiformis TaxID=130049 RepID=UPI00248C7A44|nr:copper amine oxidase N-terminal domain-containing protein [Paenibacillus dendritiformis]WGU96148.1 copper amine oxidase N-terminal domain-containing protein [Paenibacillus dendritiformis]